jgi:hypothetical protein
MTCLSHELKLAEVANAEERELTACNSAPSINTAPATPIRGFLPSPSLIPPDNSPPIKAPKVVADVIASYPVSLVARVRRESIQLTCSTSDRICPRSEPMITSVPDMTPVS